EAVVGRIVHGAVKHAVDAEQPRRLVELVLDLRALRDLDDRAEVLRDVFTQLHVVPRMHTAPMIRCEPLEERPGFASRARTIHQCQSTATASAGALRTSGGLGGHVEAPMTFNHSRAAP